MDPGHHPRFCDLLLRGHVQRSPGLGRWWNSRHSAFRHGKWRLVWLFCHRRLLCWFGKCTYALPKKNPPSPLASHRAMERQTEPWRNPAASTPAPQTRPSYGCRDRDPIANCPRTEHAWPKAYPLHRHNGICTLYRISLGFPSPQHAMVPHSRRRHPGRHGLASLGRPRRHHDGRAA